MTQTQLESVEQDIASHHWETLISGQNVACYAAWGTEPGTDNLRKKLIGLGKRVYLPVITSDTQMLWGLDQPPYSENRFGIPEPEISDFELGSATAIILPALCADLSGVRLGRGAGYFDRALEDIPAHQLGGPIRIALLFDDEVLPSVPSDIHDQLIDLIVTPTKVIHCKK